jgi:hypothetical protein
MSPSVRDFLIYLFVAICAFFLASRAVTVALMLMYAPEEADKRRMRMTKSRTEITRKE